MSKNALHILKNKEPGSSSTLVDARIPVSKIRVPVGKQILNYLNNIHKAILKPTQILAPQNILGAGGKVDYTLSEDIQKIRGEAYDAGMRSGLRQSAKLERYVEGEKAIVIFERGKTYGYNNGYTAGADAGAKEIENRFGGFEDLEETAYNPDNIVALIGNRFVVVDESDDEFSLLQKRYGREEMKKRLLTVVDKIVDGKVNQNLVGPAEKREFIKEGCKSDTKD